MTTRGEKSQDRPKVEGPQGRWKHSIPLHALLIALLGLAVYSNTFGSPFTFDDGYYITENPIIKNHLNFIQPSRVEIVTQYDTYHLFRLRPVGHFTFFLNYYVGGLDVTGYHAVNLAIHVANAFLLYGLVTVLFRTPVLSGSQLSIRARPVALFSALLFVSHPLQIQAVTYITQRFASLTALFYLSSVLAYAIFRLSGNKAGRRLLYAAALIIAALAMKTKENAFTLPIMIAAFEIFFMGKPKRALRYTFPFLPLMLLVPIGVIYIEESFLDAVANATRTQWEIGRWEYLVTQTRVLVTYLRLYLLPVNQNLDYDYPLLRSVFQPGAAFSLALLLLFAGAGVYLYITRMRRDPAFTVISFCITWFFVTVSIESGLIALPDLMFEHRTYLPSAGVFSGVSTAGALFYARMHRHKSALLSGALLLIAAFSITSYARNDLWRDDIALWRDVVSKSPFKVRPHSNLGNVYKEYGLLYEAEAQYLRAIELDPGYTEARNNLGVVYDTMGRYQEAEEQYLEVIRIDPGHAEAHNNLGAVYQKTGRLDEAIDTYNEALDLYPPFLEARNNLASAYAELGRYDDAEREYLKALADVPDNAKVRSNLGVLYVKTGRMEEAVNEFEKASRIEPGNPELKGNLDLARRLLNKTKGEDFGQD